MVADVNSSSYNWSNNKSLFISEIIKINNILTFCFIKGFGTDHRCTRELEFVVQARRTKKSRYLTKYGYILKCI